MKKTTLSQEELSDFCLELSLLFHAGVGAGDALALLAQEEGDSATGTMLAGAALQVDDGLPLSAALRNTGRFPSYVCGLLEVGEQSGRTEEALTALSHYYEDRARLSRRIRSALLYPAVMLVLMLVVIAVLLMKVLPIFDDVYASLGGRLTGVAGGLLALGRGLDAAMPVLCVVLAAVVIFLALFAAVSGFRQSILSLWRRSQGDKGVSHQLNCARVAQAMTMGMRSGMLAEEAIDLAAGLLEDTPAAKQRCLNCRALLENGASLSTALKDSGLLPPTQCRVLELGQRSGSGDMAMERIAAGLSEAGEAALENKVSRVEPALVLVCSILVGLILLSVMLPLMNIMAAIG